MSSCDYDGLILDLDGTLLDEHSRIHPLNKAALLQAEREGVRVMIATGRSSISAHPLLEELGFDAPAIVFNGAGLYCHKRRKMLEERVLSRRTLERALAFGRRHGYQMVVMCADRKLATHPRDECERSALEGMTALELVSPDELQAEFVMRVTYFSRHHVLAHHFECEIAAALEQPAYLTSFPLNTLASHRMSPLQVVDVHPPCRGKAEALRVLEENDSIPPERVVAIGDATNDLPMFEACGLAVAMSDAMPEARQAAQRVIGSHNSCAIAELVEELFLAPGARQRARA